MEKIPRGVTSEIEESLNKISVSTQCKVCERDFTESTIFKHVSHRPSCKAGYSEEEIKAFQDWKKQRDQLIRKRKSNPAKRREWYLKQKEKKLSNSIHSKGGQKEYSGNNFVSTTCLGCKVTFNESTILRHISKSSICEEQYPKEDLRELDAWTKERKEQKRGKKRKLTYDPVKRRATYLINKAKKDNQMQQGEKPLPDSAPVTVSTLCKGS